MLYIARHGQTDWNKELRAQGSMDIPLNATGREQAQALAASIKDKGLSLTHIYSSVMKRASETAEIVGTSLCVPYTTLENLQEVSLGVFEGLTRDEMIERYPEIHAAREKNRRYVAPTNGESLQHALERVVPVLLSLTCAKESDILVISHGGIVRGLCCLLSNEPFENFSGYILKNATMECFSYHDIEIMRERL